MSVSLHHHRPIDEMARSLSHEGCLYRVLCLRPHRSLDLQIWLTRHHHLRQGLRFYLSPMDALAQRLGISTTTTTAYNPEANGIVERFHRSLKAALMSRCTSEKWKLELPWVLLGLRTTPKDVDDHAPAEKVYGDNLTVPADFFRQNSDLPLPELRDAVARFIPGQQT